jgi:hypothetical protein
MTDWISETVVAAQIGPAAFSIDWAALRLSNALEHLNGAVTGREPRFRSLWQHRAEDVRAYEVELAAAEILSSGRFESSVRSALDRLELQDSQRVLQWFLDGHGGDVLKMIEMAVNDRAAESDGEAATRRGFAVVAMGLVASEQSSDDPEIQFESKVRFLERLTPPPTPR